MAANVNRVTLVCRLTRDPELRSFPSGMSVCSLRVAFTTRKKDQQTGEWGEKPNYIDVTVWGRQGENVAQYCQKGKQVALDGRLEWREWEDKGGQKRQTIEIVADHVEFLSGGDDRGGSSGGGFTPRSDVPSDVPAAAAGPVDDDIPF